nr:MAG TPA: hypothetical protein [Caudoviricetes sp.]
MISKRYFAPTFVGAFLFTFYLIIPLGFVFL